MLVTCGLLLLQAAAPLAAPTPPPALAARIHELVDGFKGQVFLYAKNLDTGASFGLREDERVRTASTIKLAVMVEAFDRVERGELGWEHPLTLTAASQVGGSGILGEFAPGLRLTLQEDVARPTRKEHRRSTKAITAGPDDPSPLEPTV